MAARGIVWSSDETQALISLWADEKIQALLEGARHNHKIFAKLAENLNEKGFEARDGKQCQDKVRKLKLKYRSILDNNNKSGNSRKNWEFFEVMDRVLGSRPTSRPQILLQTLEEDDGNEDQDDGNEDQDDDMMNIGNSSSSEHEHGEARSAHEEEEEILDGSVREENCSFDADVETDRPSSSTPKSRKRKREATSSKQKPKKNKTEKAVDSAIEKFTSTLKEMNDAFLNLEAQRQEKDNEVKRDVFSF